MLTAFNRELGAKQGRIVPAAMNPITGEYVFCLGHDTPGHTETMQAGDFALVEQTNSFSVGAKVLRIKARVRPPATTPPGHVWLLDVMLDDVVKIRHRLRAGGPVRDRSFALNVSKLVPGSTHILTICLRLATEDLTQYVSMASFECGPPPFQQISVSSIDSQQAFGTLFIGRLPQTLFAGSNATDYASGNAQLNLKIAPNAITSGYASGAHFVRIGLNVENTGNIASAFASGTAKLNQKATASPIASSYASGTAKLVHSVVPSGIATAYASGSQSVRRHISPSGVASGYASGSATLSKWDPTQKLSMVGFWRNYDGNGGTDTWTGTATLGSSGSNDIAMSNMGTPGSLNGHATAVFDTSSATGTLPGTADTYCGSNTLWGWILIKLLTGSGTPLNGNTTNNFSLQCGLDAGVNFGLLINNSAATAKIAQDATNVWQLITFRYTGSLVQIGKNQAPGAAGGASSSSYSTNFTSLTSTVTLSPGAVTMEVAELGLTDQNISDGDYGNLKAWMNEYYALSL